MIDVAVLACCTQAEVAGTCILAVFRLILDREGCILDSPSTCSSEHLKRSGCMLRTEHMTCCPVLKLGVERVWTAWCPDPAMRSSFRPRLCPQAPGPPPPS